MGKHGWDRRTGMVAQRQVVAVLPGLRLLALQPWEGGVQPGQGREERGQRQRRWPERKMEGWRWRQR